LGVVCRGSGVVWSGLRGKQVRGGHGCVFILPRRCTLNREREREKRGAMASPLATGGGVGAAREHGR
jgi:hypothetical protein